MPPDLVEAIEEDHRAVGAFVRGDPEPKSQMFSRREDVSVANPLGPPVRGWDQIKRQLEGVASQVREGEPQRFERISEYATEDLAYVLEIERCPGVKSVAPMRASGTRCARPKCGDVKMAGGRSPIVTPIR